MTSIRLTAAGAVALAALLSLGLAMVSLSTAEASDREARAIQGQADRLERQADQCDSQAKAYSRSVDRLASARDAESALKERKTAGDCLEQASDIIGEVATVLDEQRRPTAGSGNAGQSGSGSASDEGSVDISGLVAQVCEIQEQLAASAATVESADETFLQAFDNANHPAFDELQDTTDVQAALENLHLELVKAIDSEQLAACGK